MERVGGGLHTETVCTVPTNVCPNKVEMLPIGECGPHFLLLNTDFLNEVARWMAPPLKASIVNMAGRALKKSLGPDEKGRNDEGEKHE